ncbi:MAG: tRNA 2'-O-methylase [Candidatus Methanofastidiosum methylothiophilum]|uniref:tRNA 2'-O-methylase n=1 Tax=Candidatus Methanofastidiosum methylothiophilum TaxID=1705564 RepID=A0A150ISK6_9EURY|nr:MAG: tRNA 2'-O-methylase [Candidatus Methanofastidiosum methylthiophilus]KYC48021.1 MAG: tRNA 2'-O-methylase [Candidatus Methanofastidiosum methylthiophilus]KYC50711.1 MAG: tRNA 2'-O-methylase [Candidatus Methanofastidiosum methylthiophilus]
MISKEEAISLLRSEGCSESVIKHSISVSKYAKEIAEKVSKDFEVDLDLVEIGGLLHDIGRSKTNGIFHGILGADLVRQKIFDEKVALICERHVGSGIDKKDAEYFGLPSREYIPQTLEEKIVCHADNFFIDGEKVSFEEVYGRFIKELGESHSSIQRLLSLQKELQKYL